jgi:NAD(P)H-dependent FMN reductase
MHKLHVIIASTRPGRAGLPIGNWFYSYARQRGTFDTRLVDLAEVNLPMFDEPRHPRLGQYEHAHTKAWSAVIAEADAFVFVTPEYNYSAPPSLLNAIDYLHKEWQYKPAGFVSYGGPAGGTRSVQMLKQPLAALKVVPLFESVTLPLFSKQLQDGVFQPNEGNETAAATMLDELARWTTALKALR